ncbi:hypothetical protein INR49_029240 [Caranx melampygus]|nr:hypothetical protein INR49_029240 [Caranx melampygus]
MKCLVTLLVCVVLAEGIVKIPLQKHKSMREALRERGLSCLTRIQASSTSPMSSLVALPTCTSTTTLMYETPL